MCVDVERCCPNKQLCSPNGEALGPLKRQNCLVRGPEGASLACSRWWLERCQFALSFTMMGVSFAAISGGGLDQLGVSRDCATGTSA